MRFDPGPSSSANRLPRGGGSLLCGRGTMGGATLLVLVTLVLATGTRAVAVDRHSLHESRWIEPTTTRSTRTTEARTEPASAPRWRGPSIPAPTRTRTEPALAGVWAWSELAQERCDRALFTVRSSLLDLPPPTA